MTSLMATVAVPGLLQFSLFPTPSLISIQSTMGLKKKTLIPKPWNLKLFLREPGLGLLSDLPFSDLFPKLTPPALHP